MIKVLIHQEDVTFRKYIHPNKSASKIFEGKTDRVREK
jgi:hypothetical protein